MLQFLRYYPPSRAKFLCACCLAFAWARTLVWLYTHCR